jgi:ADP-ribosylglycohydrolase
MHPKEALNSAAGEAHPRTPISEWVRAGIASISEDTCRAVGRFGQMCETASAFPATVHLIAKYEESLEDGLIENVMAGGDSAGRGLLVGLVLGAYNGESAIPKTWITDLKARSHIDRLLTQIDSSRTETE